MPFKAASGPNAGLWIYEGQVAAWTKRAVRFVCERPRRAVWLPRGRLKIAETRDGWEVAMPEWLARAKGLL